MREIRFKELNETLALALGLDAESGQLTPAAARKQAAAINAAVRYAWDYYPWPETTAILPSLMVTVASGEAVPVVAPGYKLLRVFAEDPVAAYHDGTEPQWVDFRMEMNGAVTLQDATLLTPYYAVQLEPPSFGAAAWDAAAYYGEGSVIYDTGSGDCFQAVLGTNDVIPPWEPWGENNAIVSGTYYRSHGVLWEAVDAGTATAERIPPAGAAWQDYFALRYKAWAPQRLPDFLFQAVLMGAEAWMTRTAGQAATSAFMEAAMGDLLASRVRLITLMQRQGLHSRLLSAS